ncbi:MAG TPA: cation diffusion facilitator family transporter [Vicinamibacteria bacterium]|nr:cation diffusion facilitator family transporter [Vicinamibacteria bacterium]
MAVDTVAQDATGSGSAPDDGAVTGAAVRRVLGVTLLLNLLVSAGKIVVGKMSGSLSMVADGYHSLTDGMNNVVGLVVATFAYKPPDAGHPYGHRKFETAATLLIGLALLGVAYHVVEQALSQVASSRRPEVGALNWIVMGVTLVANMFVAWYERREGRRLGSAFLIADSAHTRSDIYVTMGVVASFAGARAGLPWMDGLVAAGIAAFIAFLAVQILIGSFNTLTDRAVLPSQSLEQVVLRVPGVRDCRDIRTRGGEGAVYVDLIVHVDGDMRIRAAHDVADRIESALMEAHPEIVDVVVHLEPA